MESQTHSSNVLSSKQLILATTSIYRLEIFKKLGLHFTSEGSNVDEYTSDRPSNPVELTKYLAKLKAEAVAKNHGEGIIIGFDSVGLFEGQILEKPKTREEGFARLKAMSGKTFTYHSGVHVINLYNHTILSDCVKTEATMRPYSDAEINKYLDNCEEKYKTHAHGFDPSNYYSMTFIQNLNGDPFNMMMGIPLSRIIDMLEEIGYEI